MKKILFFLLLQIAGLVYGQKPVYVTSGAEWIFSFAEIQDNGKSKQSSLRFAPILNLQAFVNKDLGNSFGLFTGLALRNVGYRYKHYTTGYTNSVEKRFRSYNIAVPVGFRIGNLSKISLYGGYEFELPILYKEKTYDSGDKIDKITGWFSNRQQQFQHGFLVGIQFPYGFNLKFKYYVSEFHNQNYIDANGNKPYQGLDSHIFYFSLNSLLFRNTHFGVNYKSK